MAVSGANRPPLATNVVLLRSVIFFSQNDNRFAFKFGSCTGRQPLGTVLLRDGTCRIARLEFGTNQCKRHVDVVVMERSHCRRWDGFTHRSNVGNLCCFCWKEKSSETHETRWKWFSVLQKLSVFSVPVVNTTNNCHWWPYMCWCISGAFTRSSIQKHRHKTSTTSQLTLLVLVLCLLCTALFAVSMHSSS